MKARKLRSLLNNTTYSITNRDEYIAVGSSLVHNLISVDKKSLKVRYALDTFHEGRKAIRSEELEFIWDKLHELIESGEIKDIIEGKDVIENPLPVFTIVYGSLIESVTDKYGWPNTDDNGITMFENTHFPTKKQAIEYGLTEYTYMVQFINEKISSLEDDLRKEKLRLDKYFQYINDLSFLL